MTAAARRTPSPPGPAAAPDRDRREPLADALAGAWERFWFTPADPRPLAIVRIVAAALALLLWSSYAADLAAWFDPGGLLPVDAVRAWRSPAAFSLFDLARSPAAVRILYAATGLALALVLVGAGTTVTAPVAALLFATLTNRVPMLAGPADDVVAVLLWCLAVGPCGGSPSVDAARHRGPAGASWRAGLSLGLMQVHLAAIAGAAAIAQLKGDCWWNGLASWHLATAAGSGLGGLVSLLEASDYLGDLITHAIPAFEILLAVGLWFPLLRRPLARIAVCVWPLVGLLAGEPWWGAALAALALPFAMWR
jgi:hypothetical protein